VWYESRRLQKAVLAQLREVSERVAEPAIAPRVMVSTPAKNAGRAGCANIEMDQTWATRKTGLEPEAIQNGKKHVGGGTKATLWVSPHG
jgi:hypothetical protein